MPIIVIALALIVAPVLIVLAYIVDGLRPRQTQVKYSAPLAEYMAWREEQQQRKVVSINDWRKS